MGIFFSKNKRNKGAIVSGDIKYHNLTDWWLNELTLEERNRIREVYKPMSSSDREYFIDEGNIEYSSCSDLGFIGGLAGWFQKVQDYEIAEKILKKGNEIISNNENILDEHFFYLSGIRVYYKNREKKEGSLDKAIYYCNKQIEISKLSKEGFLHEYPKSLLPEHTGYKQLAIIYEKNKNYQKALTLSKRALSEGWSGDWEKRIARLEKKLNSQ